MTDESSAAPVPDERDKSDRLEPSRTHVGRYKGLLVLSLILLIVFLEGLNWLEKIGFSHPNATLNQWGDVLENVLKHPELLHQRADNQSRI